MSGDKRSGNTVDEAALNEPQVSGADPLTDTKCSAVKVLIIEDERDMAEGLCNAFEKNGFEALVANDGEAGLNLALTGQADVIILDLMLPKLDGMEICKRVRTRNIQTPIIMLTARGQITDRVEGLEIGADDYVTKPFSVRELIARVRALLRRQAPGSESQQMRFGKVTIDLEQYVIFRGEQRFKLTAREVKLLKLLVANPHKVISRERTLNEAWGYDKCPTTRTVDTFIYRLRRKMEDDPRKPEHLLTVHGIGYRFVP